MAPSTPATAIERNGKNGNGNGTNGGGGGPPRIDLPLITVSDPAKGMLHQAVRDGIVTIGKKEYPLLNTLCGDTIPDLGQPTRQSATGSWGICTPCSAVEAESRHGKRR